MAFEYFVYCSKCGFYPAASPEVSVGVDDEEKALNLADLHSSGSGHHCFVIPSTWITSSSDGKKTKTKYSTGKRGMDTRSEMQII